MIPMDTDVALDPIDEAFTGRHRRCCCFYIPSWSATRSSSSSSADWTDRPSGAGEDGRWWSRAAMKLREWSELVAGPRWKTFIRRFNRNHPYRHFQSTRMGSGRFQYDPLSYALNFDEGHGESPEGEHAVHRDFPSRFAMPAAPEKSSSAALGPSAGGDPR